MSTSFRGTCINSYCVQTLSWGFTSSAILVASVWSASLAYKKKSLGGGEREKRRKRKTTVMIHMMLIIRISVINFFLIQSYFVKVSSRQ